MGSCCGKKIEKNKLKNSCVKTFGNNESFVENMLASLNCSSVDTFSNTRKSGKVILSHPSRNSLYLSRTNTERVDRV